MLITVMSEGELHIPRLGRLAASPGFRLVAAMNPFDAIGTARISGAVYDRVCRLAVGYQSASDEGDITRRAARTDDLDPRWVDKVVELVRLTRTHPDLRVGSSVRGAIDMCAVASSLGVRARRTRRCRHGVARRGARRPVRAGAVARGNEPDGRRHHPRAVGFGVRHASTTGRVTREKRPPRLGPRPPPEVPAALQHEGGRRSRRGGHQESQEDDVATRTRAQRLVRGDLARGRDDRRAGVGERPGGEP